MITFKGFCTFFGPHQTLTLVNLPSQNHTPYLLCNLFCKIYLFVTEYLVKVGVGVEVGCKWVGFLVKECT